MLLLHRPVHRCLYGRILLGLELYRIDVVATVRQRLHLREECVLQVDGGHDIARRLLPGTDRLPVDANGQHARDDIVEREVYAILGRLVAVDIAERFLPRLHQRDRSDVVLEGRAEHMR